METTYQNPSCNLKEYLLETTIWDAIFTFLQLSIFWYNIIYRFLPHRNTPHGKKNYSRPKENRLLNTVKNLDILSQSLNFKSLYSINTYLRAIMKQLHLKKDVLFAVASKSQKPNMYLLCRSMEFHI